MEYEFRIYKGSYVDEVHIFENGSSNSVCGRVSRKNTKKMGIYGDRQSLLLFSKLDKDQARDLASTLDFLKINVCGTCVSHLYRT